MGVHIVSVAIGLVTTIVGWVLARLLLRPQVRWSPRLSVRAGNDGRQIVRGKLKNGSYLRSVQQLDLMAELRSTGLDPTRPTTSTTVPVPIGFRSQVRPRRNHVYTLRIDEIDRTWLERIRGWGREIDPDSYTLADLLDLHESTRLVVRAAVVDGWTGDSAYVESPAYGAAELGEGLFARRLSPTDRVWVRLTRRRRERRRRTRHRELQLAADVRVTTRPSRPALDPVVPDTTGPSA